MAFANVAGRAGFVLELDKSQLDRGLPQAEQQFNRATASMAQSASRSGVTVSRQFDSLLGSVRGMQGRADELAGSLSRVGTATESAGIAGAGLAGRFGLVATAAYAAYNATQELARQMKVTGEEATTTQGKLQNFGSALLQGDIVGSIKALERGQDTFSDLGIAAKDAAAALGPLQEIADTQGGKWRTIYEEARLVAEAYREVAAATLQVLNASTALRDAQGNVIVPGGFAGLRPQPFPQPVPAGASILGPGATPVQGPTPIGPTSRRQAAIAIAQARGDLDEVLRLQIEERARLTKALENSHGNVQQRQTLNTQLAAATAAVIGTQKQIEAQAKARKDAADAAAKAADAAAKAAKDEADRRYRDTLAAREQVLRNQYARAQATSGTADDRRTAAALSAFLGGEGRDPRLDAGERADFRSRQIAFIKQRTADTKAIADAAMQATRDELSLQEQTLRNNVAAAQLTEKNKQDDLRALRALRDFFKSEEIDKDLTAAERQGARGSRIATQKQINDLLRGTTNESSFTLADLRRMQFEFLQSLQGITNQFGGNLSSDGAQTAVHTWRNSKLTEQVVAGIDRLARATAHPGAKYARNELMEPYGSFGTV